MPDLSPDTQLVILAAVVLLLPRMLQRLRLPSALGALGIGLAAGLSGLEAGRAPTLHLLATLGISALFLFAGMDVDFAELRRGRRVVAGHLAVQSALLAATAALLRALLGLDWAPAVVFALALVTPSTGFILDSLAAFGLGPERSGWVKTKAIATELVALAALFVTVQSGSGASLAVSILVLVLLVAALPWAFRGFARHVLPWAPRSEFTFLVVLAVVAALVTRRLGVYYLVGAFVVGLTTLRLRQRVPELGAPQLVGAVELFASFFTPFYFFEAGYELGQGALGPAALGGGLLLLVLAGPARFLTVALHRWASLGEPARESAGVALSLLPTLVFTLVLAGILRDRFGLAPHLFGALGIYAIGTTLAPGLLLRPAAPGRPATTPAPPTSARAAPADAPPEPPAA